MNNHTHQDWEEEKEETKLIPKWKEIVLSRIGALLGPWGKWADKVGFKNNETQIQFKHPVNSYFSYDPLNLMWVQFNTYDPFTKRPSTRVVRFGPDTAVLMVLVKSGNKLFLLARGKYQFAGKDIFREFSRGWVEGAMGNDQGWKLFERDFPGLKGNPMVGSIIEKPLGSPVWENNTEYANKISHHLIVVELREEMSKEDIEKILVEAKLRQEYPDESFENLGKENLTSQPVILDIEEAAKLLNAHLEGNKEVPLALFGENFSTNCWSRFLTTYCRQVSSLLPVSEELI